MSVLSVSKMDDAQKKAIMKAYGSRLPDLRRQQGLSQEALSEEMRYSVRQIQKVEAGKSNPSLLFISNWLEITNVDIFIHSQTTPIIQRATEGCPGGGTDKPPPPSR